jgi:hypothetical protein
MRWQMRKHRVKCRRCGAAMKLNDIVRIGISREIWREMGRNTSRETNVSNQPGEET